MKFIESALEWVSERKLGALLQGYSSLILLFIVSQLLLGGLIWIFFKLQAVRQTKRLRRSVTQCLSYSEFLQSDMERSIAIHTAELQRVRIYVPGRASDLLKALALMSDGLKARISDAREMLEMERPCEEVLSLLQAPLNVRISNADRVRSGDQYPPLTVPEVKTTFDRQIEELGELLTKRFSA